MILSLSTVFDLRPFPPPNVIITVKHPPQGSSHPALRHLAGTMAQWVLPPTSLLLLLCLATTLTASNVGITNSVATSARTGSNIYKVDEKIIGALSRSANRGGREVAVPIDIWKGKPAWRRM